MWRNIIKEVLESMRTSENESSIERLLKLLNEASDEVIEEKFRDSNIDEVKKYIKVLISEDKKQQENSDKFISDKFININELFCYGIKGNTLHMHLIPKDLRPLKKELGDKEFYRYFKEQLEDFLSKIQVIISEDDTIQLLFAASTIFYHQDIASIHESLGFDKVTEIDLNDKNDDMSVEQKIFFLNMFNKKEKNRKVYYTKMTREKLLKMEYSQNPENRSR